MGRVQRHRLPADLLREIELCGFYPQFVSESLEMAIGGSAVHAHVVHHEATFAHAEVHRHLTALVLTDERLIVAHVDENPAEKVPQAISSVEVTPVRDISSVVLTRVMERPDEVRRPGPQLFETWLTISWGTVSRLDLEPAGCPDPECIADHGYTGTRTGEDLTMRMSRAADGVENATNLVTFASTLQSMIGRA